MHWNVSNHQAPWASRVPPVRQHRRAAGGSVVSKAAAALAWVLLLSGALLMGLRLAGYQFISARGDSMEPAFSAGSLLLAQPAPPDQVRIGDIIAFPGASDAAPKVVHRVVGLLSQDSDITAVTMGDNNPAPDPSPVTLDRPVARVIWMAPYAGWWVTPTIGWLLLSVGGLLALRAALGWRAHRSSMPKLLAVHMLSPVESEDR